MARKRSTKKRKTTKQNRSSWTEQMHPEVKKYVWVISLLGVAVIFILAAAGQAGPFGQGFYAIFSRLFGWGYYLLPVVMFLLAFAFMAPEKRNVMGVTIIGALVFVISGLGLIDVAAPDKGGLTGAVVGSVEAWFGVAASVVILATILVVSFLIMLNRPLQITASLQRLREERQERKEIKKTTPTIFTGDEESDEEVEDETPEPAPEPPKEKKKPKKEKEPKVTSGPEEAVADFSLSHASGDYEAPPLSLLTSKTEKPTGGDLKANANIIKRTLESFGVPVEMSEIQVGPTVTRYALKPAEGVKLSRITGLNQDLALALAAHPIRIEAPIPGKSLVGIEVPNKSAAIVRLGSLLSYPEFKKAHSLSFVLGRAVNGEPVFPNIAKMPHLLIAGATGSGKSITIHTLLMSLLYKNSPETLRLIMVDPKRVELSVYNDIPHLIAPVIVENKKAVGALKWAINEMDRRYEMLLDVGARDITSYNKKTSDPLPYVVVVIDELADLMSTYGREVEGAIVRLAQMSRAVGIHLIVSTQRPSVEVITGLIKANITSRIALQVASQIDSRTILDTAGAEKLLGHGDLLFISSESSKPQRIQGAFVTEQEIRDVTSYIKEHNESTGEAVSLDENKSDTLPLTDFDSFDDDGDELLEDAIETVRTAKKASASLLQRRLRVGYARAARLLDMMEERGIVGPAEGAKPREVYGEDSEVEEEIM